MREFDVLVVGGGHAGCEAAAAAARIGASTALITLRHDDLGVLSCNPAIGGLGKGHLVREIDALDGLIGHVGDAAAIQYRLLNRSKGPAVQGPRAQVDRKLYAAAMRDAIVAQAGLTVIAATVESLVVEAGGRVVGVETAAGVFAARSTVITSGTFLDATLHHGIEAMPGGRHGGGVASRLSRALRRLNLPMTRFKTGTPPRLDGRTIDWARLEMQYGDVDPARLSDSACMSGRASLPCGITRTNATTHAIIRRNIGLAPMYAGRIDGVGPRYCPSIEDKVMRFGERDGHQVYLEPEGFGDATVYPNGISTSLPAAIQSEFVRTIHGLERARITRPGYAVEYGIVDPRALTPTLAVRGHAGLFLAGQINGTTGYEEAAGQGIVAGINAARSAAGEPAVIFDRASSYIGVMIDDLVVNGVSEPYRMFTSRAEFRLSLRTDNAAARLTPLGVAIGVVGPARGTRFVERDAEIAAARDLLGRLDATPHLIATAGIEVNQDGRARTAAAWLAHPAIDWAAACQIWPVLASVEPSIGATLATDMHYAIYLDRQANEVRGFRRDESLALPQDLDFSGIAGLSTEMVERLAAARPATLGAAKRVAGVTSGALTALLSHTRRAA
jgi:tRNA uridine 5-carboxymethylaminomethyl modification enzyme